MFAWVGSQFDAVLSTYVLGVVSSLMTGIAPIALTAMTIWVALYGWAVLRNEVPETVPTFLWKVFKIGLVLAFALQSGFYISNVADTANALATGVANTFLPSAADPTTISSPYALLDRFNDGASQLVLDMLKDAGIMRLDLLFAAVVCSIGNVCGTAHGPRLRWIGCTKRAVSSFTAAPSSAASQAVTGATNATQTEVQSTGHRQMS
jgi:type IV secretion system protein VirB6